MIAKSYISVFGIPDQREVLGHRMRLEKYWPIDDFSSLANQIGDIAEATMGSHDKAIRLWFILWLEGGGFQAEMTVDDRSRVKLLSSGLQFAVVFADTPPTDFSINEVLERRDVMVFGPFTTASALDSVLNTADTAHRLKRKSLGDRDFAVVEMTGDDDASFIQALVGLVDQMAPGTEVKCSTSVQFAIKSQPVFVPHFERFRYLPYATWRTSAWCIK